MNTTYITAAILYFAILAYAIVTKTPMKTIAYQIAVVAPLWFLREVFTGIVELISWRPVFITTTVFIGAMFAIFAYGMGCGAYLLSSKYDGSIWHTLTITFATVCCLTFAYSSVEVPRKLLSDK